MTIKEIISLAIKKDLNFQENPNLTVNWCNFITEGLTETLHDVNPLEYVQTYTLPVVSGTSEYDLSALGDFYIRGAETGLVRIDNGIVTKKYRDGDDYYLTSTKLVFNSEPSLTESLTFKYFLRPTLLTAETDDILLPQPTAKMTEFWVVSLGLESAKAFDDTDYTVERYESERSMILDEIKKMASPSRKRTICL